MDDAKKRIIANDSSLDATSVALAMYGLQDITPVPGAPPPPADNRPALVIKNTDAVHKRCESRRNYKPNLSPTEYAAMLRIELQRNIEKMENVVTGRASADELGHRIYTWHFDLPMALTKAEAGIDCPMPAIRTMARKWIFLVTVMLEATDSELIPSSSHHNHQQQGKAAAAAGGGPHRASGGATQLADVIRENSARGRWFTLLRKKLLESARKSVQTKKNTTSAGKKRGENEDEEDVTATSMVTAMVSSAEQQLRAACRVDPTLPWVIHFCEQGLDAVYAVALMFTIFLYTVDSNYCECAGMEECFTRVAEEAHKVAMEEQKLKSNPASATTWETQLAAYRKHIKHIEKPQPPTNNVVCGWNSAGWAVMNWLLRVVHDPSTENKVRSDAVRILNLYEPFQFTLEEALYFSPKSRSVVFRGVPVALANKFTLDSPVIFPPFTSTAIVGKEALKFMNLNKPGTFFILIAAGSMVNHLSWYPEQSEQLLTTFRSFRVKSKVSKTVLQLLGRKYDIVTVVEEGPPSNDEDTIRSLISSVKETVFVYDGYLSTYVEGKIAKRPPPTTDSLSLFEQLERWLYNGDTSESQSVKSSMMSLFGTPLSANSPFRETGGLPEGCMKCSDLERALMAHGEMPLTKDEVRMLLETFDPDSKGYVNYELFIDTIFSPPRHNRPKKSVGGGAAPSPGPKEQHAIGKEGGGKNASLADSSPSKGRGRQQPPPVAARGSSKSPSPRGGKNFSRQQQIQPPVSLTPSPTKKSTSSSLAAPLSQEAKNKLHPKSAPYLLLLGGGGTGKTSATLALLSRLAQRDSDRFFPFLISLPAVPNTLEEPGCLDAYMLAFLGVTEELFKLLSQRRTVVAFLDSLDEAIGPKLSLDRVQQGLLKSNPLLASCRIVLSCRTEALALLPASCDPSIVLVGEGKPDLVEVRYIQPFSDSDVELFVNRAILGRDGTQLQADNCLNRLQKLHIVTLGSSYSARFHPVVLRMVTMLMQYEPDVEQKLLLPCDYGCTTRSAICERYLRLVLSRGTNVASLKEPEAIDYAMERLGRLALTMLNQNEWSTSVSAALAAVEPKKTDEQNQKPPPKAGEQQPPQQSDSSVALLERAPARVEDISDGHSSFAWFHKSIGEFLCAYMFKNHTEEALRMTQTTSWSQKAPVILTMFAELDLTGTNLQMNKAIELLKLKISNPETDPIVKSNAVALVAACGHGLSLSLEGLTLDHCNLASANLGSVKKANFNFCDLSSATVHDGDITESTWAGTTCDVLYAPLVHTSGSKGGMGVWHLALNSTGSRLVSACDSALRVWNTQTAAEIRLMESFRGAISSVHFHPDGSRFIVFTRQHPNLVIYTIDALTFEVIEEITHKIEAIPSNSHHFAKFFLSIFGTRLISVYPTPDEDKKNLASVSVVDLPSCVSIASFMVPVKPLPESLCRQNNEDGGDEFGGEKMRQTRPKSQGQLHSCATSTGDRVIFAEPQNGDGIHKFYLWHVPTQREIRSIYVKSRDVHTEILFDHCQVTPDDSRLVACIDKLIIIIELASGQCLKTICLQEEAQVVQISPDSTSMLVAPKFPHWVPLLLYDTVTGERIGVVKPASEVSTCAAFSGNNYFAVGGIDGTIRVWNNIRGGSTDQHSLFVFQLSLSSDGKRLLTCSRDTTVRVWDVHTGKQLVLCKGHNFAVSSAAWDAAGKRIISGDDGGFLCFWSAQTGKLLRRTKHQADPMMNFVRSVAMSRNGTKAASARHMFMSLASRTEPLVRIWNTESFTSSVILDVNAMEDSTVIGMAFVDDAGAQLLTGDQHGVIYLWNTTDGTCSRRFEGHTGKIFDLRVDGEVNQFLSCSSDATVRLWDISRGKTMSEWSLKDQIKKEAAKPQQDNLSSQQKPLDEDDMQFWGLAASGKFQQFLTISSDAIGRAWSLKGTDASVRFDLKDELPVSCDVSRDGNTFVVSSQDGPIRIWKRKETSKTPSSTPSTDSYTLVQSIGDQSEFKISKPIVGEAKIAEGELPGTRWCLDGSRLPGKESPTVTFFSRFEV